MKPTLPLSVVVPALGRVAQTRRLLDSLAASDHAFEVILVDDATPIPLASSLGPLPDGVRVLRQEARRGPAAARNRGAREASHAILAFTDNDCVVQPGWAARIFTYASRLPRRFAGVGGRTVPLGTDLFSRYYGYHKTLDPWLERGRYLYVVTANAAFRRGPFEEVGGFDEGVTQPGGEDPGLCFKLQRAGYELGHDTEAIVFHDFRPSVRDFARTFFRYGAGCRDQAERYDAMRSIGAPMTLRGLGGVALADFHASGGEPCAK